MNNRPFWQYERKGRATERRHRIAIWCIDRTRVAGGFASVVDHVKGHYWASVEPISETQRVKYQSVSVEATHRITVDGSVEVNEGDRIEFNGREFDIITIQRVEEGRRDKIIITREIRPGQKK